MSDPRLYQIGTLASLLVYGMGWLDFDITLDRVVLLLATVLAHNAPNDGASRVRQANATITSVARLQVIGPGARPDVRGVRVQPQTPDTALRKWASFCAKFSMRSMNACG